MRSYHVLPLLLVATLGCNALLGNDKWKFTKEGETDTATDTGTGVDTDTGSAVLPSDTGEPPSPCAQVACGAPPPPRCVVDTDSEDTGGDSADTAADTDTRGVLRVYDAPAACDAVGACVWLSHELRCPSGLCTESTDTAGEVFGFCKDTPCLYQRCDSPPPPTCASDTELVVYAPLGVCARGSDDRPTCTYASTRISCPTGCADGACVDAPCRHRRCAAPPPDYCKDATTLVTYQLPGVCTEDGTCRYTPLEVQCPTRCDAAVGRCEEAPCLGKMCYSPWAATCATDGTWADYQQRGACADGFCFYFKQQRHCAACDAGYCEADTDSLDTAGTDSDTADTESDTGATGCVSWQIPAPSWCASAGRLVRWKPTPGGPACSDGVPYWETTEVTCANGCSQGACVEPDAAEWSATCFAQPADHCAGSRPVTWSLEDSDPLPVDGTCAYGWDYERPCTGDTVCSLGRCVTLPLLPIDPIIVQPLNGTP